MNYLDNNIETKQKGIEINLAFLFKVVLKKWWLIIIAAVLFGILGGIIFELTKDLTYTSDMSFIVYNRSDTSGEGVNSSDMNASVTLTKNFTELLSSRNMCEKIAKDCSFETSANKIKNSIKVSAITQTSILQMSITTDSAAKSYEIATHMMTYYKDTEKYFEGASINVNDVPRLASVADSNTSIIMVGGLAAFVGAFLAAILVIVINTLNDTVTSAGDISSRIGVNVLGTVSHVSKKGKKGLLSLRNKKEVKKNLLITDKTSGFAFIETYKAIRTKLENERAKNGYKTFVISSASENEGKTTVSVNIALALAKNGHTVLIIDADLRKPAVCKILGLAGTNEAALGDVIDEKTPVSKAVKFIEKYNLFILAGTKSIADPTETLSNPKTGEIIKALEDEFDFIIIDTSPAGVVADASIIANYSSAIIFVVRENLSPIGKIRMAVSDLSTGGTDVVGAVFNNVASGSGGVYSRYGKRYGYGRGYDYGYGYSYGYGYPESGYSDKEGFR